MTSSFHYNLKHFACIICNCSMLDQVFRYLNKNKLLVVMYHGVTKKNYDPPVWTQLTENVFREQLKFLSRHYRIVTLDDVTAAISGASPLPDRAALITFDDGLKNNFTVAFPILKELNLPATIFLTVDYLGTRSLLWFDEMNILLREKNKKGQTLNRPCFEPVEDMQEHLSFIESLKHSGKKQRDHVIRKLRESVHISYDEWLEDFGLLEWEDVLKMHQSGLVNFGVHTATHSILTELDEDEWDTEIITPKEKLESFLKEEITAFCFPNGRADVDFKIKHFNMLQKAGYLTAFTTENMLFNLKRQSPYSISRIPAGNDGSSDYAYFRLNTSGCVHSIKELICRAHAS